MGLIKYLISRNTIIESDLLYFSSGFSFQTENTTINSAYLLIYDNGFINQEKRDELINKFTNAQKIYWGFSKLAKIFKHRKAKTFDIHESLYDIPFADCNPKQIITLTEGKTKYKFRINELIYLWKIALENSQGLTPMPKNPSNPYTGLPFSYHNLYNIYFFARMNTYINIPETIGALFKLDFDLKKFNIQYYPNLCEKAIKVYLHESENIILFYDCINMICSNEKLFNYPNFDKNMENKCRKEFVDLLKPILTYYLYSTVSHNPFIKKKNRKLFRKSVKKIMKEHPTFGRRVVQITNNDGLVENYNRFALPIINSSCEDSSEDSSEDSNEDSSEDSIEDSNEDSNEVSNENVVNDEEEIILDINYEIDSLDTVNIEEPGEELYQEEYGQWRDDQNWSPNEYASNDEESSDNL